MVGAIHIISCATTPILDNNKNSNRTSQSASAFRHECRVFLARAPNIVSDVVLSWKTEASTRHDISILRALLLGIEQDAPPIIRMVASLASGLGEIIRSISGPLKATRFGKEIYHRGFVLLVVIPVAISLWCYWKSPAPFVCPISSQLWEMFGALPWLTRASPSWCRKLW